ncbi:hypothetical protein TNCV_4798021 [Trichonephila clavipes]|nr:hypothetical protein TNCV_4798021 [Trichonephila clavipes]
MSRSGGQSEARHQCLSPQTSFFLDSFIDPLHLHAEIVEVEIEVVSPSIVPSGNFAELNRTVTCMALKANDKRTSCPCHDEFRGPRSDYVRQALASNQDKSSRVQDCMELLSRIPTKVVFQIFKKCFRDAATSAAKNKTGRVLIKSNYASDSPCAAAVAEFRLLTGHDCLCAHLYRFNLTDSPFVFFWISHGRFSFRRLRCTYEFGLYCEEIVESSLPNDLMVNDVAFDR